MRNKALTILVIVLLVFWVIGAFIFVVGKVIHILLIIAAVVLLARSLRRRPRQP